MVDNSYDPLFNYAGQKYNVDPALLRTVFRNESSENANTRPSSAGALGGMQMLPDTARAYGAPDPTDMRMAIPAAAIYLRKGLDVYGSPEGALAAYHGGFDTSAWGPKTAAYVQKGIDNYPQVKQDMIRAAAQTSTPTSAPMPSGQTPTSDPDVDAGAKFLSGLQSGSTPSPSVPSKSAPSQNDSDVEAGKSIMSSVTAAPSVGAPTVDTEGNLISGIGTKPEPTGDKSEAYNYIPPAQWQTPNPLTTVPSSTGVLPAIKQGYLQSPNFLSAPAQTYLDQNYPIAGGIVHGGNALMGAMGGAFRGAQQAVADTGNVISNSGGGLGNELAGAMEVLPMLTGAASVPAKAAPEASIPLATNEPAAVGSGYLKGAPAVPDDLPAMGKPSVAEPVQPASGASPASVPETPVPAESTVGAAQTSQSNIPEMDDAEARARQAMNEGSQLEQTDADRRVGGVDVHQYVPGVQMTLGRLDLAHAPEEAALRDLYPETFKPIDTANNAARVDYLDQAIPTDLDVYNMKQARDVQAKSDLAPMQNSPQPVDLQPVSDLIDQQLVSGGADRGLIANQLNAVKNTLSDADGNLRTDPNRIYNGARKNITDMLERAKADPASNEATASANLVEIKNALDNAISENNPSFQTYLDNYSSASGPIDEAQLLGDIRKRVTNATGTMQLGRVDSVLNSLDKARNDSSGVNAAQHVTPESMDVLFNLRNDLQAEAAKDDMVRTVGSNTHLRLLQGQKYTPPIVSPYRNAFNNAAELGVHGLLMHLEPSLVGNMLLRGGSTLVKSVKEQKALAEADALNAAQESARQARVQQFTNPVIPPQ